MAAIGVGALGTGCRQTSQLRGASRLSPPVTRSVEHQLVGTQDEQPREGVRAMDQQHSTASETANVSERQGGEIELVSAETVLLPPAVPLSQSERVDRSEFSLYGGDASELVDFGQVLSTASGRNPQLNFASERVRQAYAELEQAELLWLPSLRAGMNVHYHNGKVQNARGEVLEVSRNAMYGGLASRAVGGGAVGLPGVWMQFHMADAIYQPRVADQVIEARHSAAESARNDTLLAVALAYLQLMQRVQEKAIADDTVENLNRLANLCREYAAAGISSPADAERVYTERAFRQNMVKRSIAAIEIASTELARLLSIDPTVLLIPNELSVVQIALVQDETPVRQLVATGLSNRPELREHQAIVCEAVERLRRETYAPLLPSLLLGTSYGVMAGGQRSHTGNFGDRFDFDVAAWWEIRQLGLGERAIRDAQRSKVEQARWKQIQIMDQVAQDVTQAHILSRAKHSQVDVARGGLEFALDSYRLNMERIGAREGLPIEALQSVQALDTARRDYLRAIVEYNEAQFRLYRAIGWPIEGSGPLIPQQTEVDPELEIPVIPEHILPVTP